jgi:hypothetical protein
MCCSPLDTAVLTDSRGFKGLKQAIKLEFKLARYDQVHSALQASKRTTDNMEGSRTLQGASHLC